MSNPTLGIRLGVRDVGAGGDYTQLKGMKTIPKLPDKPAAKYKTTRLDQVDDGDNPDPFHKYAPGMVDPGELQVEFGEDEDNASTLDMLYNTLYRLEKEYQLLYSNLTQHTFTATLINVAPAAKEEDEVTHTATFAASGDIVYTPAP